jgi:hypothetical protein
MGQGGQVLRRKVGLRAGCFINPVALNRSAVNSPWRGLPIANVGFEDLIV